MGINEENKEAIESWDLEMESRYERITKRNKYKTIKDLRKTLENIPDEEELVFFLNQKLEFYHIGLWSCGINSLNHLEFSFITAYKKEDLKHHNEMTHIKDLREYINHYSDDTELRFIFIDVINNFCPIILKKKNIYDLVFKRGY